jgi:hypothetical protein
LGATKSAKYDIVINVNKIRHPADYLLNSLMPSINSLAENTTLEAKYSDYGHIAKYPVYEFRPF